MSTTTTDIRAAATDSAVYLRPEWMSAEQWGRVSAALTDQWLSLLEAAARGAARCVCGKPASHVNASADGPDWACRVPNHN